MFFTLFILALAFSNPVAAMPAFSHDASHDFNYVVVIVMENQGLSHIINKTIAPFMNQLALSYGLAVNYTGVTHPSLPNYLSLIAGQDFTAFSKSDCNPGPNCFAGNATNIVDSLEGRGLTWKAYMENYPSNCGSQCSAGGCFMGNNVTGGYVSRHDPFVYFSDIVNSTSRCSNIVPASSDGQGGPDGQLLTDLSSRSTSSNFMWLTPNLCNDMHDSCNGPINQTDTGSCDLAAQCVPQGDSYLEHLVPLILSSNLFTRHNAALFITFDEGAGFCPLNNSSADCVYTVWAGPNVKAGFKSTNSYNHYSFLSTLETVWHLKPLTSNDATATPMTEFFVTHHHGHHEDDLNGRIENGHDRDQSIQSDSRHSESDALDHSTSHHER